MPVAAAPRAEEEQRRVPEHPPPDLHDPALSAHTSWSVSDMDQADRSNPPPHPALSAYPGQLKLAIYVNHGLLTVHVVQARQLKSASCGERCNSFVQVKLIPDGGKQKTGETDVVYDTSRPVFEDKISFEMNGDDEKKRVSVSVLHKRDNGRPEFLGCMSFGVKHLLRKSKDSSGWYHLLPEKFGKRKHILVQQHPQDYTRRADIPKINKALDGMDIVTVIIKRGGAAGSAGGGGAGFGFSVVGACPVRVGRVDAGSAAAAAGLRPGDLIVSINGRNVSRSTNESVARIVRGSDKNLILDVNRAVTEGPVESEDKENRAPYSRRPLPRRPVREPSTPGDVTYEQLMSPLSCPLDPPPAPRSDYQRTLTEGRLLNTYIEPVSSQQLRQNYAHEHSQFPCAGNSDRLCQESGCRALCDSDMPPPPVPSRNYASIYSFDSQDLQSVSQLQAPEERLNVTMLSGVGGSLSDLTEFTAVSESKKPLGPWASAGALDLWPSSIEALSDSEGNNDSCDSAERAFIEATSDEHQDNNSTDSRDQVSPRHNFTISFKNLPVPEFDRERHSAIEHLMDCEGAFIHNMSLGMQLFSRPLRHCVISHAEHMQLFQNVEKLVSISEYHLSQLTATLLPGSSYKPRVSLLCDAYSTYTHGLRKAQELLHQLNAYPEFKHFLASTAAKHPTFSIEVFLERPTQHFRQVTDHLDAVFEVTSRGHEDFVSLSEVTTTLHKSCRKVLTTSLVTAPSSAPSLCSAASRVSGSSGASRVSSASSGAASIDAEVRDIQNRLTASGNEQDIQLAVPNRHMIYNGELMVVRGAHWVKAWCVLLSDVLLLTRVEASGHLFPLEPPLPLNSVASIETTMHPSELVLVGRNSSQSTTLTLRAATLEQKCVWKNLIEQRVGVCRSQCDSGGAVPCFMSDTYI